MEQKRCISSLTLAELTAALKAMGQPGFRAKQIFHWVHQKLVTEFSAMTDQPKTLLAKLEKVYIAAPKIQRRQEAKDGTVKYLLQHGRRQLHRDRCDALPLRQHGLRVHAGGLPHGLPLLRLHPGRPRAQPGSGRDCSEIYTAEGHRGAHLSHRPHGHRGTAG